MDNKFSRKFQVMGLQGAVGAQWGAGAQNFEPVREM